MVINIAYTNVRYSMWVQSKEDEKIAKRANGELNIYDGKVTKARIAREIPNGATVESVHRINKSFEVDGEKALDWLLASGVMKK